MPKDPITETNALVEQAPTSSPPIVCLLTGSSGCGKTYLCEGLTKTLSSPKVGIFHFDLIGIPSLDDMIREHGSGEKWQEAKTYEWIGKLAAMKDKTLVFFEGQYHPQFALDACRESNLVSFQLAVVTCDQAVWERRLKGPRDQPDLITDDMRNWARLLRQWTVELGGAVIDTSASELATNMNDVANLINPLLRTRING